MEGGSQGALDGFRICASVVASLGEDAAQQLIYFPRNFLMDCSSRFFPDRSSLPVAFRPGEERRFSR
jgi:hypothetical protein